MMELEFREAQLPNIVATCKASRRFLEGATVIAGARKRQLAEVAEFGVSHAVAIDDDAAIASLEAVDGVADTVGGETAAKLFGRIRNGGRFGYASVFPADVAATNPPVKVTRVFARPDASKIRELAEDIHDGALSLPIYRRMPLCDAAIAHALIEKGGREDRAAHLATSYTRPSSLE
jgi:NADPH:quinone reductase-like Zn-dependent oxidoreductase